MNDVVSLINELRSEEREYLNNYLANAPKWLLEAFQIVRLKKGTTFIHENAHVDTVYILVEGIVKATDYRIQEVAYDYTRFYPIEVFGAMEFLMGYDLYKTTLMTETDCRFLCVSKDQFSRWMLTDIHAVLEPVSYTHLTLTFPYSMRRASAMRQREKPSPRRCIPTDVT